MALNRFAVTALPKSRKDEAVANEILINRDTGEILVKSNTGTLTSYDKQNRLDKHIHDLTLLGHMHDVCGDIYSIELDNVDMPSIVDEDTDIITVPMLISEGAMTDFMVSIDADMLAIDGSGYTNLNTNQPLVEFDITFFTNITHSTTYGITGVVPLDQLSTTPFKVTYPSHIGDTVDYKIYFNTLKIKRTPSDNPLDIFLFILHSILATVKLEVV